MESSEPGGSGKSSGKARSKRPAGYAPILPAPRTDDPSGSSRSTPTSTDSTRVLPKRPRVGVPVACNYCRLKKTRCDGGKPACATCIRKKQTCTYEDLETRDAKGGSLLLEAVSLLNCLTPAQMTLSVLALRDLGSSSDMINSLRQDVDRATRSRSTGDDAPDPKLFSSSLKDHHPCAYPPRSATVRLDLSPREYLRTSLRQRRPGMANLSSQETGRPFASPPPAPPETSNRHPALDDLDISKWTNVAVPNDVARKAMALYFETDHPLLSPFHQQSFVAALTGSGSASETHCSPLMVNSLLYWCCQMYSSIEIDAVAMVDDFRSEAERLVKEERQSPTRLTMVSAMFLGLGYLAQGKDHAIVGHLCSAVDFGVHLGLFGVPPDVEIPGLGKASAAEHEATAYSAWGVFNWTVLIGLFYRQSDIKYPRHPPSIPVPSAGFSGGVPEEAPSGLTPSGSTTLGRSGVFGAACYFWSIMHDVYLSYYEEGSVRMRESVSLEYAEFKFRELLAWVEGLPLALSRSQNSSHQVMVLHMWLHSAILDLFRPFLRHTSGSSAPLRLRTFAHPQSTPDGVFEASVSQLKHLIVAYGSNHGAASCSMAWQTALLYTANAMLRSTDADRMLYFLICLYSYQGLRQSFRVTEAISSALLSMGMETGDISGVSARKIFRDLRRGAPLGEDPNDDEDGQIRALFMTDLERALEDPQGAMTETLAAKFQENLMITDYTNVFDDESDSLDLLPEW